MNFLWVEKYRPSKIKECILPSNIKKIFQDIVDSGKMQNLLLCGGAGCGKTTVAKALCKEMEYDYIFINASENGNIDTIRTTIRNFASTVSLGGNGKAVILDEADQITSAAQGALRGFIEEFSSNCKFILTCNFKNKIIDPLHSRCTPVDFKFPNKDKVEVVKECLRRCEEILTSEKVTWDKKILLEFIMEYFPDFRRILNELQKYGASGKIDSGILSRLNDDSFQKLIEYMKNKNFTEVRKWVGLNIDLDHTLILKKFYTNLASLLDKTSIPSIVILLSDYQYKLAFSADPEITLSACFAEIMLNAQFV